jgi:hypothetical protein
MADPNQTQPVSANNQQPGFLQALSDAARAIGDNIKTRYFSPSGAQSNANPQLSAGPGSVLGDKNVQLQQLSPTPGGTSSAAQMPATNPTLSRQQLPYGSGQPGEQRIDVTDMVKPLGGLSGVRRNQGANGGI